MITRSQLSPMPEYFDRYINKVPDVTLLEALYQSLQSLQNLDLERWQAIGDRVYAPDKWSIKDILQHIIDTERVFSYRALSFARGEQEVKPFDENLYAAQANASGRTLASLQEETIAVRQSTCLLFQSFDEEMLQKMGIGFKGLYAVQAIGYIIVGHQTWHLDIIDERYMPLLQ